MIYLFGGIYIDYDYRHSISYAGSGVISQKYKNLVFNNKVNMLSQPMNIKSVFDRVFLSSDPFTSVEDYKVQAKLEATQSLQELSLLDIFKTYANSENDLVIYCDRDSYTKIFIWWLKTFQVNRSKGDCYDLYDHLVHVSFSLLILEHKDYLLSKQDFYSLFEEVTPYTGECLPEWKSMVNIAFQLAAVKTRTHTAQIIENFKAALTNKALYMRRKELLRFYRLLVENFNSFKKPGFLYKEDNKIKLKLSEDFIISNFNQDISQHLTSSSFLSAMAKITQAFTDSNEALSATILDPLLDDIENYIIRHDFTQPIDISLLVDMIFEAPIVPEILSSKQYNGLTQILCHYIINDMKTSEDLGKFSMK